MRVLILGGDGLLGHRLATDLAQSHEVVATFHGPKWNYPNGKGFYGVDVRYEPALFRAMEAFHPHVVVNAVGVVKRGGTVEDQIAVNALFPHRMAVLCQQFDARFIHFSTDCVFSGKKGSYTEDDIPDAEDVHGKAKFLGEVSTALTLRTSFIGLELSCRKSLVEWFLSQKGTISGYTNAIYTGVTTSEVSKIIEAALKVELTGVWHVASSPISKHDLLIGLRNRIGKDIEIRPYPDFRCDRSLIGARFEQATGYKAPSWNEMLNGLAQEIRGRD